MGDMGDYWRDIKEASRERTRRRKSKRASLANEQYQPAAALAFSEDMELLKHTDFHYQLFVDSHIYDLYPTKCRIVNSDGAPFLEVPTGWTLMDVVRAAVKQAESEVQGG